MWTYSYESIDHQVLLSELKKHIHCTGILSLIEQYGQRVEIREGHYAHLTHGIPKGCPLSPLIAAFYLKPLDDEMHHQGFCIRFMDDWLVMVKTKRQLRKIIKLTHHILNQIKLKKHPDKTYFGCIKKGSDFLGIHFGKSPEPSKTSLENHSSKLARRYAQGVSSTCIGRYIEQWTSWCKSLLQCCSSHFDDINLPGQPMENNHEKIY
jgi:RNA-directed DNA polymerase